MKKVLILIFCLSAAGRMVTNAQQNMVIYHMKTLPQRQYANPALNPDARFYIGIPTISSTHLNASITGFTLKQLSSAVMKTPSGNTLDVNRLGDVLGTNNYFKLGADMELISFGFKAGKKNFFFANSTLRNQFRMQYPGDLMRFALQGNGGNNLDKDFQFGFGVDLLQYLETGIGYSRAFSEKLTIGARAKYLIGINDLHTEAMNLSFKTNPDDYSWLMSSDIRLHASSSIAPITINDSAGLSVEFGELESFSFPMKNTGLGLDLGARYDLNKRITLSASIIDLGYINWTDNSYTIKSKNPGASYYFDGVEVDNFFNDSTAMEEAFRRLGDTLAQRFDIDASPSTYRTAMFTEFYLGGNLNINKNHNAGVLFYGNWYNRKFYPAFTLSWNSKIRRILGVSLAWSYMNRSLANLGAGLSINAGPVQWYAVSDNIFSPIRPLGTRSIDLRFGMNITLLRKAKGDTDK